MTLTPLQLGLAVLGTLVLLALVVHSVWTTRRHQVKRADEPQRGGRSAEMVEPTLGPAAEVQPPTEAAPPADGADLAAADAPSLSTDLAAAAPLDDAPLERIEPLLARRSTGPRIDALVDAIAAITVDAPVSGETALGHLPPTRRAGTKPLLIEGLNAETSEWELPAAGQRYREFQAAVQLANRGGALNEIEYSEFVQKAQAFAEPLGALPDFPDMLDVVARARELDAFASQHDAQLAMRLAARGAAWSPGYVQQHAARHGFVLGPLPGRLVQPAAEEGASPVLSLQFDAQAALADDPNQAPLRELILAFDVPQTAASAGPFAAWCAAGQALAAELDAVLLDDGGQPLPTTSFDAIGLELERLYAALAQRDLAAGSPAARRLFS